MKTTFRLIFLLVVTIICTGCGKTTDTTDNPTSIPAQTSALFSDSKNPDIRGTVVGVSTTDGIINALQVEGVLEEDTKYDKASVRITERTRIYVQTDNGYKAVAIDQLLVGQKVEVLFIGIILERYPVSAEADEILITP